MDFSARRAYLSARLSRALPARLDASRRRPTRPRTHVVPFAPTTDKSSSRRSIIPQFVSCAAVRATDSGFLSDDGAETLNARGRVIVRWKREGCDLDGGNLDGKNAKAAAGSPLATYAYPTDPRCVLCHTGPHTTAFAW